MPQGFTPSTYQTIRNYNSISYNYLKDVGKIDINKVNKKKVVPKGTISSGELLYINKKVALSEYENYMRNLRIANKMNGIQRNLLKLSVTDSSPQFFYKSPTKYTRDYFGSTLYKNNNSKSPTIAELEKNVTSQYWIKKSDLPNSQGHGIQVYQKTNNIPIKYWYKYYPHLPMNYYNYSFL